MQLHTASAVHRSAAENSTHVISPAFDRPFQYHQNSSISSHHEHYFNFMCRSASLFSSRMFWCIRRVNFILSHRLLVSDVVIDPETVEKIIHGVQEPLLPRDAFHRGPRF